MADELTADEVKYFTTRGEDGPADAPAVDIAPDADNNDASAMAGEDKDVRVVRGDDDAEGAGKDDGDQGESDSDGDDTRAKGGEDGANRSDDVGDRGDPRIALRQERERAKAREADLKAQRERADALEAKIKEFEKRFEKPAEPAKDEDPEPDPDTEPYEHQQWTSRELARIRARDQQRETQTAEQREHDQVVSLYRAKATQYAETQPDFAAAYQHLQKARHAELEVLGVTDPAQREDLIRREEYGLARQSLAMGRNPGEVLYALAQHRGYAAAAAKDEAKPDDSAARKIEAVARGQAAAKSIGAAGGGGETELSVESVLKMSEAEFAKLSPEKFRRLAGG